MSKHWQKPKDIKALAVQANELATLVLNGAADMEKAKLFCSLARVVSQATSLEVTRGRFLKEIPNLSLEGEEN